MLNKKVYLLGMPGSGKSTLGKQLSELLNYPFFDLDTEIEKEEKSSIPELFNKRGERYFRKIESKKLAEISRQNHFILATGGGTPCFNSNIDIIKNFGTSIYIKTSIVELVNRLEKQEARPIFDNSKSYGDQVDQLLKRRELYYNQADIIIENDEIKAVDILEAIIK